MQEAERIRRDFAIAWGEIGAAWGVAPSTARVHGYLLLYGGPLTEAELREALGISHRATLVALAACEHWGLIEQAAPRRTGTRGPAARAWIAIDDHWEWFRRVSGARKEREADPVFPLLDMCLRRAEAAGDRALRDRLASLLGFTHLFDRAVSAVVRSDARVIGHLFGVLGRLDDRTVDRLLTAVGSIPEDDLVLAAARVASMPPQLLRTLVRFASRRGVGQILSRFG